MYTFLHGSHSVHPALLNASFISLLSLLYRILFEEEWRVHWCTAMMQSSHVQSIEPEKTAYATFLAAKCCVVGIFKIHVRKAYVRNT